MSEAIKPGYKQTEIGVIPEEWEVKPLGRFVALQRGHDLTEHQRRRGEVPVMGSAGPNGCHDTALVRGPGVVLGRSGASFGQAHYCECDFWPHNTALYVTDFFGNHPLFSFYFLKSIDFSRHNTGGAQQSLNRNFIAPIVVAVPNRVEQEAIAEALSDADALIESLEQLIAKKRHLKQGAMQELLTGKRRLPGFSGQWANRRLDQLGTWKGGMTPSMREARYWEGGTVPWISSGDVKSVILKSTGFCVTEYAIKRGTTTLLPANAVIIVTRSGILRKYLPVATNAVPMAINQDIKALQVENGVSTEYVLQSLLVHGDQILSRCLKAGTTVESIELRWLKAFAIPVPPYSEQAAIAAVLSDMDAEIAALEAKLAKARQVKHGMMQELLTGRTRLVQS